MTKEELNYVETKVKVDLTPEIRSMIPTLLGWVLKAIFPKMEAKIITFIEKTLETLLKKREDEEIKAFNDCGPRPKPKFEPGYWNCSGGEWTWVPAV